jgi:hypothetical protein
MAGLAIGGFRLKLLREGAVDLAVLGVRSSAQGEEDRCGIDACPDAKRFHAATPTFAIGGPRANLKISDSLTVWRLLASSAQ